MEDGCREEAGVEGCIYVCLLHDVFLCDCATEAKKELANFSHVLTHGCMQVACLKREMLRIASKAWRAGALTGLNAG